MILPTLLALRGLGHLLKLQDDRPNIAGRAIFRTHDVQGIGYDQFGTKLPHMNLTSRHCSHFQNQVSVFGHIKYGYDYYYPCLDVIPEKPANRLVKHGSSGVWNSVNCTLFIAGNRVDQIPFRLQCV